MTRIFLSLFALLLALFGAGAWGSYQWQRDTNVAFGRLECCAVANPLTYDPAVELVGLPEPVQRYFRNVLRPGQVLIRRVRQTQVGEFRTNPQGAWSSLRASQVSIVNSPGFVWDARISIIHVRDSYSRGEAAMTAKVLGLVPVVDVLNAPELATAALQRHLGEAMWFPTALLPSQGVSWTLLGPDSARATLTDGQVTATLDFRFNQAGEITGAYTGSRFQERKGKYVATPWEAVCSDYAEQGGMRIPMRAEVAWIVDGKREPYWRARISQIEFE